MPDKCKMNSFGQIRPSLQGLLQRLAGFAIAYHDNEKIRAREAEAGPQLFIDGPIKATVVTIAHNKGMPIEPSCQKLRQTGTHGHDEGRRRHTASLKP